MYECKKNEDKKYVKTYNASVFIDETNLRYTQRGAQRFTLRSVSDGFCRFGALECEFQLQPECFGQENLKFENTFEIAYWLGWRMTLSI